jgi:hypothetical protein
MTKRIALITVIAVGLSLAPPGAERSWSDGGSVYGSSRGWGTAIIGGLVAGVIVIGNLITGQDRPTRPAARKDAAPGNPKTAHTPADREFEEKCAATATEETASGNCVSVPGQWTDGVWVPEHMAWVADKEEEIRQW